MRYTHDLTDAEGQFSHSCFPKPCKTGRSREPTYRERLNAMFSVVRTGCQWRNLPKDFAPWGTVYHYNRLWKRTKFWEQIHAHLREHLGKRKAGNATPAPGSSTARVSRAPNAATNVGAMPARKSTGRKRHVLVDTLGWVLLVLVLPASLQDRNAARPLLEQYFGANERRPIRPLWADGGYAGALIAWAWKLWRGTIQIVKRTEAHVFKVLPRRWVVERTFGWLGRYGRLNREYERQAQTGEVIVYIAMIRLMLARLAKP